MSRIFFSLILLIVSMTTSAQEIINELEFFKPIIGKEWYAEMGKVEIHWQMKPILDGTALKRNLRTSTGVHSEMIIYWDPKLEQLEFIRVVNKKSVIKGKIVIKDDILIKEGTISKPDFYSTFTNTIEIVSDTIIIDKWYNKDKGLEHYIKYIFRKNEINEN